MHLARLCLPHCVVLSGSGARQSQIGSEHEGFGSGGCEFKNSTLMRWVGCSVVIREKLRTEKRASYTPGLWAPERAKVQYIGLDAHGCMLCLTVVSC